MLYFMGLIHPLFTFQIKGLFFTDILRKNCCKTQLFPCPDRWGQSFVAGSWIHVAAWGHFTFPLGLCYPLEGFSAASWSWIQWYTQCCVCLQRLLKFSIASSGDFFLQAVTFIFQFLFYLDSLTLFQVFSLCLRKKKAASLTCPRWRLEARKIISSFLVHNWSRMMDNAISFSKEKALRKGDQDVWSAWQEQFGEVCGFCWAGRLGNGQWWVWVFFGHIRDDVREGREELQENFITPSVFCVP